MKVQCPAKVNLFLEVTGRRRDGYHTLATLFAKVNLFDTLDLQLAPKVELTVDDAVGSGAPAGEDNLVARAARAFLREFGLRGGARLHLEKKIPAGAGLGGGSSDAAGALVGLSRLYGLKPGRLLKARLKRVAAGLGADVPFFLEAAPLCLAGGVGDKLRPLETRKALPPMLLVYPGVGVPTAGVYRDLRLPRRADALTRVSQLDTLSSKLRLGRPISEWAGLLFNRLEEPVLPKHPEVATAKAVLARLGARGVLMSGSGSSVFGFVDSQADAERARRMLQGYPWLVFSTCAMG